MSDSVTPWTTPCQASLSFTISWSLLRSMSTESVMPSNRLILCHPLLLLPSIFPSISVFSNESALHIRWSKYWSFSFSISPSNEYSGLISFRIDWFDLLAVQGTLKSLQRIIQLHFTQFHMKLLLQNKQLPLHITWHHRLKCNLIQPNIFRLRYSDFKKKCLPSKEKSIINTQLQKFHV